MPDFSWFGKQLYGPEHYVCFLSKDAIVSKK
ncbi:hypothetical protein C8N35_107188 [Breoghania corrubedonensis]|uniref:Uncharacterized protein n=1 Tax=Breoghania corrubedonensis TaxID=665038 RepID=A0A2T5V6U2_9HYPH|nr:hypothetical protein C8N35_107188 [Breoghania corrubedonensis]